MRGMRGATTEACACSFRARGVARQVACAAAVVAFGGSAGLVAVLCSALLGSLTLVVLGRRAPGTPAFLEALDSALPGPPVL